MDNEYVSETSDIFDVFKAVISDEMTPEQLRKRINELEASNSFLRRELLTAKSELGRIRQTKTSVEGNRTN